LLTLSNLRPVRVEKGLTRPQLATLTDIDPQRLKSLELRTAEPWFDEAVVLSRILRTPISTLITSGSLTSSDYGPAHERDTALWRTGARSPLSLACRVAEAFGLDDPAELTQGALARQVWEIIGANDRHPEYAGVCPWCAADVGLGERHLETCLPNNLWGSALPGEDDVPAALKPAVKQARTKGIAAHNLKTHRDKAHMIQKEVADLLGINPNYYARIERGDVPLTTAHADKLAAHYGVDRAALYFAPERV
jgi:transcriptional regulator with XRE-family HTH domain